MDKQAKPTRAIPAQTLQAIDMWDDFLKRAPKALKLPSFPIWSMEFRATYPYEDATPPARKLRRPIQSGIVSSLDPACCSAIAWAYPSARGGAAEVASGPRRRYSLEYGGKPECKGGWQ